jgi:histidine ammonia-lyase
MRVRAKKEVSLGESWTLDDLYGIAHGTTRVRFDAPARDRVTRARAWVEKWSEAGDDAPNVYGVNTGFGALAETRVRADQMRSLQRNLIRSHAAGVGEPFGAPVARAMIALRAQTLALGHSGVRPVVIETLIALLDSGIVPFIPAQGSVGASGDLAPLAHLALVILGEGEVIDAEGRRTPSLPHLERAKITPIVLEAKEGLALINGTQMIVAVGALALVEAEQLVRQADVVGAMSLDALEGSARPFDVRIQAARPHPGQAETAANLRGLLAASEIMESHRDCDKVQDPYSLRCMPQIHGASRDVLRWARTVLETEIIAATDNPLIFLEPGPEPEVISGGNFHGQPLAIALDAAALGVAELANVSERRIEQLVNPAMSSGLPPFLAPRTGLDSGFMMAQVTAAALVSENKILAHPASVDSIPSSAGKEDHVSMGSISARKLAQIVKHVRSVLAVEMLVASQGLDLRQPRKPGKGVAAAHAAVRSSVPTLTEDRPLYKDIAACESMLAGGAVEAAVEAITGELR